MHSRSGMARRGCILRRVCAVVVLGAIGCDATGSVGAAANVDDVTTSDAIVSTSDDAATSSSAGTEEATTGASGFDASCCAASIGPGCDDAVVVACVCAGDSY